MAASEGMTHTSGGRHVMSTATPSAPAATAAEAPATGTGRLRLVNLILELRAFIALIVLIIVFSLLSDSYLTYDNLVTMTRHVAINALLAIGMLMVILTGGIDLSVGSIVGLAGIVAGVLLEGLTIGFLDVTLFPPVWAVVIIVLAVGAGVGRDQRHDRHALRRRAVHRDARHALRRARRRAADLQRRDLSRTSAAARSSATPASTSWAAARS